MEPEINYTDTEGITRISAAAVSLDNEFQTFAVQRMQNFYRSAGHILSSEDLSKLEREKRPNFQIDLMHPQLLQVLGNFKGNMPAVEIHGVTQDDYNTAQVFQDLNDFILYQANDMNYQSIMAYLQMAIGRISFIGQKYSFSKDPEGMVDIFHQPKLIYFDTKVTQRDFSDCQFMCENAWFAPEEIVQIYARDNDPLSEKIMEGYKSITGESTTGNKPLTWAERLNNQVQDYIGSNKGYDGNEPQAITSKFGDWISNSKRLRVTDFYERRQEKRTTLRDILTGRTFDISTLDSEALALYREQFTQPIISSEYVNKIYQISICPALQLKLFEGPTMLQNGNFPYTPITCYNFHPSILETKSMYDKANDSIKDYNLSNNTFLTALMRQAHAGWIAEESAFSSPSQKEAFKKNEIAGIRTVAPGAVTSGRIKQIDVAQISPALSERMGQKFNEVKELTGVSPNAKGQKETSNESGRAVQARVVQSELMQEFASDNVQAAFLQVVKNNIYYIQNYFTEERTFRILRDNSDPYWITINQKSIMGALNDTTKGKYDVKISPVPAGRVGRELKIEKLATTLKLIEPLMGNPVFVPAYVKTVIEMIKLQDIGNQGQIIKLLEQATGLSMEQLQMQQMNEMMMNSNPELAQQGNQAGNRMLLKQGSAIN